MRITLKKGIGRQLHSRWLFSMISQNYKAVAILKLKASSGSLRNFIQEASSDRSE